MKRRQGVERRHLHGWEIKIIIVLPKLLRLIWLWEETGKLANLIKINFNEQSVFLILINGPEIVLVLEPKRALSYLVMTVSTTKC